MKKIRIRSRIKVPSIFKQVQSLTTLKRSVVGVLILFLAGGCILAIAQIGKMPARGELYEGDISIKDIYAPFDFTYAWGTDKAKTEALQKEAVSEVPNTYTLETKLFKDALARIDVFFDNIIMIENSEIPLNKKTYDELVGMFNIKLSLDSLKEIISFNASDKLRQMCIDALSEVLRQPILSEQDKENLLADNVEIITIKAESIKAGKTTKVSEVLLLSVAKQKLDEFVFENLDANKSTKKALLELLNMQLGANLSYSEKEMQAARKAAEESVKPFYNKHEIQEGEIIIFKGQRAKDVTVAKLSAIKLRTQKEDNLPFLSSFALILLLLFFILIIYAKMFEPKTLKDNAAVLLVAILLVLIAGLTKCIILSPLPSYFIPAACVSMLFALLIGNTLVFPLIIVTSAIISIMAGSDFNIFMVSFVGATIGAFTIKKARHRAHLIKTGFYLGMANFICISALALLNDLEPIVFLKEGLWGIGGGIFAAGITMVCLPILERLLHLSSDIGLLELSDLNHPLLKEMASKAPGTYHHSIIVGNLAEAACDAIGANSLLARVGSYYHDIGKIAKAEYFSENQPRLSSSHDVLTPHMSSLIITNHVKDGVDLAKKHRLPRSMIDMVEQHHGSGLIYYFYQKALEKEHKEESVKEEGFRYPGPKPQSKEAAIILLADSVEAASRTLTEPTPVHLEELVRRIINNKFIDRQLDECELTLQEIDTISKGFVRILIGIYHVRVEYPNNGRLEKKNKNGGNRNFKYPKENQGK